MTAPTNPDHSTIKEYLNTITQRWLELKDPPLLEIRALADDRTPQYQHFQLQDIEAASLHALQLNSEGWNLYSCVNPIAPGTAGAAKDVDIIAAFYCFADADDEKGAAAITTCDRYPPNFLVNTGSVPWPRVHGYWELDEPCHDLSEWTSLQKGIAKTLGTDQAVVNPSRIMRLAGTVAYPSHKKTNRGYIPEVTSLYAGEVN